MNPSLIDVIERNSGQPASQAGRYAEARRLGFADILREHSRSRPHDLAAIDGPLRLTWSELEHRVQRLVSALVKHKVGANDRLIWLGQNSVKLFELILASARLGAFIVPANWRLSVAETKSIIDDIDPRIVFWQNEDVGDNHRELQLDRSRGQFWCQQDGVNGDCYDALLAQGDAEDAHYDIDPASPLLGIYTSAFEGRAGAALLSHEALMLQGLICAEGQGISHASRYLVSGPMFHVGVLMGAIGSYMRGGCQIFVPRVNADELIAIIDDEKVTHAYIPRPTALEIKELAPESGRDLSSLFPGGDPDTWQSTLVMPLQAPAYSAPGGYGQTEVAGYVTQPWFGGGGAGRPHPLAQVMIVDEDGAELPVGEIGEIVVRGPMVMSGYYNRPEENERRTLHGWHRTHDLGHRNDDGSLVFVGPKTRMIKSGSENIYPAEVERCLTSHDDVEQALVIGVPDEQWDQSVQALVVLRSGASIGEQELTAYCRAHIASYKKPKIYAFVASIPSLPDGFPDRDEADRLYGGGGYPSRGGPKRRKV